jgi:hypothetical protein
MNLSVEETGMTWHMRLAAVVTSTLALLALALAAGADWIDRAH